MIGTIQRRANKLNDLLQSEVTVFEEQIDCNQYREYIVVNHHKLHDGTEESIEEVYVNAGDEMTMVWAYLQKTLLFCSLEEIRLATSFFAREDGQVGFMIKVGDYYSCK